MITQDYLKTRLQYDPLTGIFTWKLRPGNERTINSWNARYAGKEAGTIREINKDTGLSYNFINLDGKICRAHRLAWLYEYGVFPRLVDHIDGDGLNNRLSNLQELSSSNNIRKAKLAITNTSGFKGVSYRKDTGRWTARAKIGSKYQSLGCFDNREDAFEAYCDVVLDVVGELHLDLISKKEK
jgi:hypothetical protein